MRSRYSAYATQKTQWILDTTHPDSPEWNPESGDSLEGNAKTTGQFYEFRNLEIVADDKGDKPGEAFVTFAAEMSLRGKRGLSDKGAKEWKAFSERSRFVKGDDGKWMYIDQDMKYDPKTAQASNTLESRMAGKADAQRAQGKARD